MDISLNLLQEVINYLIQKPYGEVSNLISKIDQEYQIFLQNKKN